MDLELHLNLYGGNRNSVTYQGSDNFEQEIQIQMESGDTPDFALWPQPGAVVDAAKQRNVDTSSRS